MSIDYSKLHNLTARELISALKRDGFYLDRQAGSHQTYIHNDGRQVSVSFHHPGATFPPGTRKSMIEIQAKWTEEDLKRLKIIRGHFKTGGEEKLR